MTAWLFAHQGGWDEVIMVLVPIAIFALLLVVANRRANTIESERSRQDDGPTDPTGPVRRRGDGPASR